MEKDKVEQFNFFGSRIRYPNKTIEDVRHMAKLRQRRYRARHKKKQKPRNRIKKKRKSQGNKLDIKLHIRPTPFKRWEELNNKAT